MSHLEFEWVFLFLFQILGPPLTHLIAIWRRGTTRRGDFFLKTQAKRVAEEPTGPNSKKPMAALSNPESKNPSDQISKKEGGESEDMQKFMATEAHDYCRPMTICIINILHRSIQCVLSWWKYFYKVTPIAAISLKNIYYK